MEDSQVNLKMLLTLAIAVSLLGVSAAPVARAQDEAAEEAPQPAEDEELAEEAIFEDILVTATKREENIFEVPIAISAFTVRRTSSKYRSRSAPSRPRRSTRCRSTT
jgi:outer membrane receptor protein involved in Fe transport